MKKCLHINGDVDRFERVLAELEETSNVRFSLGRPLYSVDVNIAKDKKFLVFLFEEGTDKTQLYLTDNIDTNVIELPEEGFIRFVSERNPKYGQFKHGHMYMGKFKTQKIEFNGLVLFKNDRLIINAYKTINMKDLQIDQCKDIVDVTPVEQLKNLNELI